MKTHQSGIQVTITLMNVFFNDQVHLTQTEHAWATSSTGVIVYLAIHPTSLKEKRPSKRGSDKKNRSNSKQIPFVSPMTQNQLKNQIMLKLPFKKIKWSFYIRYHQSQGQASQEFWIWNVAKQPWVDVL